MSVRGASDRNRWQIHVHCSGHLDKWAEDYLHGACITCRNDGTCCVKGDLPDMAAAYGLLVWLRDAGVNVLYLQMNKRAEEDNDESDV